ATSQTRTLGFQYAPTTGLLVKQAVEPVSASISEPGTASPESPILDCVTVNIDPITSTTDANVTLVTSFSRDAFGNAISVVADDLDGTTPTRTTNVAFGELDSGTTVTTNGRFPVRVTNV